MIFWSPRSTRPVCCRAQSDDQPRLQAEPDAPGRSARDQPWQPSGLAAVGHAGNRAMPGSVQRGHGQIWKARDHEYRSGIAVHIHRLHQRAEDARIKISMDGKGAWRDNVFVERLWPHGSNTRRSTCAPMTACQPPVKACADTLPLQHEETALISGRADAQSGISQPAATNPGRGITERGILSKNNSKLFKQTKPPLFLYFSSRPNTETWFADLIFE